MRYWTNNIVSENFPYMRVKRATQEIVTSSFDFKATTTKLIYRIKKITYMVFNWLFWIEKKLK